MWINYTIDAIPEPQREKYKSLFMQELKKYSFEPRKKGEPKTSGCIHELSDIINIDIKHPEEFAKLVKEGMQLMYQKQTSARVMNALMEDL